MNVAGPRVKKFSIEVLQGKTPQNYHTVFYVNSANYEICLDLYGTNNKQAIYQNNGGRYCWLQKGFLNL